MYPLSPSVVSRQHQGHPRRTARAVGYARDGESAIAAKTAIMAEMAGGGRRSGRLQGFYGRRHPHEQLMHSGPDDGFAPLRRNMGAGGTCQYAAPPPPPPTRPLPWLMRNRINRRSLWTVPM